MNKEYVQNIFEHLHTIPEAPFEEYKTSEYIANQLEEIGFEVQRNVNKTTGLIAVLDSGKEGPVLGIRGDMDALPYEIDGETTYKHTCGHDAHSAMVLATAKELYEKGIKKGKVVFIFQPAEEIMAGALKMAEGGDLDLLTHILGIHIRPVQDCKTGEGIAALWHAGSAPTSINVKGKGAHASRPHLGNNAAEAAVHIVNAVNSIKVDPRVNHSVKVTQLNTGKGAVNAIPDFARINLDIRCQENEALEEMVEKIKKSIEHGAAINGSDVDYEINLCPAANYDDEVIDISEEAIKEVLGEENTIRDYINSGSEDFHFFAKELGIKAGYIGLGANASPGLHDINMTFDREALYSGVEILTRDRKSVV